jgi:peptidoglycan-N-acetylglucosamine deacetylase
MIPVRPPALIRLIGSRWLDFDFPSKGEKTAYLTFDDGPIPEVTPQVLDILASRGAKATFFCVGENVERYPEIFRRILDDGHAVGNHSFSHLKGWQTPAEEYVGNVERCRRLVDSSLFRPPHGRFTLRQFLRLRKNYRFVLWSVLSKDYDRETTPDQCLANVLKFTRPGSIIVFHDSLKAREKVLYALPAVLDALGAEGFRFERIS